jgi:hypothetical protein
MQRGIFLARPAGLRGPVSKSRRRDDEQRNLRHHWLEILTLPVRFRSAAGLPRVFFQRIRHLIKLRHDAVQHQQVEADDADNSVIVDDRGVADAKILKKSGAVADLHFGANR